MRSLLAAALVLLLLPGAAAAAEPGIGKAARSSPTLVWTGATTNSYFAYDVIARDPAADCRPGKCDSFRLEVLDGGADLVVTARLDAPARDGRHAVGGIRISGPGGAHVWQTGESGPASAVVATLKDAPAGAYVVDFVNTFVGPEQTYAASAQLRFPSAAASAHVPLALTGVGVGAGTSRNLSVRMSASTPLTGVTAVIARGGRKLVTAGAERVEGTARMVLRARRQLGDGSYLLTVTGTDANGRAVTAQTAVTVRRQ